MRTAKIFEPRIFANCREENGGPGVVMNIGRIVSENIQVPNFIFKVLICFAFVSANVARCEVEAGSGIVKGVVTVSGSIPEMKELVVPADIRTERTQLAPLTDERIVVSQKRMLANVVVYVSKGYERYSLAPFKKDGVEIRSTGYQFIPHVIGVQVNQKLAITSEDKTTHNWHTISKENPNEAVVKPSDQNNVRVFADPELGIALRCDVYGWMCAYICVFSHPFFAVTKADGTFEIKLPPGDYEISFWHESKRVIVPETQKTTVTAGKSTELDFEAKISDVQNIKK